MEVRLHLDNFEQVLELAKDGCDEIAKLVDAIVRGRTEGLENGI